MTNVWCGNPASFTTRSVLALPVKWGTSNLPPLIASTSGSVDQIKCLTPEFFAARTAAVASCFPKIGDQEDSVCPFKCSFECLRFVYICLDDFLCKFPMLVWIASQC